ncbi:MAG: VanZ family protein [Candidatus Firestonebacteria bacterium]
MQFIKYWLPVIIYSGTIFTLSSFSHIPGPELFPNGDKLIHFIEYGILSFLIARAFRHSSKQSFKVNAIYLAIILASLYGLTDEIHQAYVPGRDCSFYDWISDLSGTFIVLFLKKYGLVEKDKP